MKLFVAVGGAYASVDPDFFNGLCDVLFDGEAETTWPEFLADYAAGRPWKTLYRQARAHRHDQGADATLRPPQGRPVRLGRPPVLARLPFPVRVLRHHRHLRPQAANEEASAARRRARVHAEGRLFLGLHCRRQLYRQQEGGQGAAAAHHPVAGEARLPAQTLDRGQREPRRRRGAPGAPLSGELPPCLHRARDAARSVSQGDQEVPERPRRLACREARARAARRDRHQRRVHRRLRQRRRRDLRGPVPIHPGQRRRARNGGHAPGDPQNAALRSDEEGGTPGRERRQLQHRTRSKCRARSS